MGIALCFATLSKLQFDEFISLSEAEANDYLDKLDLVDVDKAWDAINFALTGEKLKDANSSRRNSLGQILGKILGFQKQVTSDIGSTDKPEVSVLSLAIGCGNVLPFDLAVGAATYLEPTTVKAVAKALAAVTEAAFVDGLNRESRSSLRLYPRDWTPAEVATYVLPNFKTMCEMYSQAAEAGQFVVRFYT